ncbi:MAG: hypothetical protein HYY23_07380 [Verrucomicrobia bacterium]|nr:hypothetical protein [Verrucomicrobiota bacterium]
MQFLLLGAGILLGGSLDCLAQQTSASVQFSDGFYIPDETGGPAIIQVTRTGNTNGPVTVDYATGEGTAKPGADYDATFGTLSFGAGVTNATFSVRVHDDPYAEGTETVALLLSNPTGGAILGTPASARILIFDNENRGSLLDDTFVSAIAPVDTVSAIVLQPDGKIWVGGNFARAGSATPDRLIRVNPDGVRDVTFASSEGLPNNTVYAIALQNDGKIIIGGEFTRVGSVARNRIARLNADGAVDQSFDPGTGVNGSLAPGVYSLVIQPDGKILVAGNFDSVSGTVRNAVARLNSDGSLDTAFDPGTGASSTDANFRVPWLSSMALQPDRKVIISGQFTDVGGLPRRNIARLNADGSPDASFDPGTGATGDAASVEVVALQADGKIVMAGDFTKVNDLNRSSVARLNPNGSVDTTFNPGSGVTDTDQFGDPIPGLITSLAIQSDGKVLLSGSFTLVDDINRRGVARLNADGALDPTFGPYFGTTFRNELGYEEIAYVSGLALQPDGKVLIGGGFESPDGSRANRLVRLLSSNVRASSFEFATPSVSTGENAGPVEVKVLRRGDSAEGFTVDFITSGGKARSGLDYKAQIGTLRFAPLETEHTITIPILDDGVVEEDETFSVILRNPSTGTTLSEPSTCIVRIIDSKKPGNLDFTFADVTIPFPANPSAFLPVTAIAIQKDGKALVAGHFTSVNGTNRAGIVRLDTNGSIDPAFVPEVPPGAPTLDFHFMGLQPDGRVVGGFNGVQRLNTNGSLDTGFTPDIVDANSLAVQADGNFIVADEFFDPVAGETRNQVSRFLSTGFFDTTFSPPAELDDWANAIGPQPDGKVVIGGYFSFVNGVTQNRITRLNSDGTLDTSFNAGTGVAGPRAVVYTLALQPDGKVIIGGDFIRVNDVNRNNIARLNPNGSVDTSFDPGLGPDNYVESLALQADGKVLIGGSFTTVDGVRRVGLARLNADGSLDSDFDPKLTFAVAISVSAIAVQADGKVLIGGLITAVNGVPRSGLARLNGNADFVKLDPGPSSPQNRFSITLTTQPGKLYRIEVSTDLINWTPVSTIIATGYTYEFEDPTAKSPIGRFYRAVVVGP